MVARNLVVGGCNAERRRFLGGVSLSVAGVAAGALLPASLLQAAPLCRVKVPALADACGDWQLDDICLAYPPYAFHTGSPVPHSRPTPAVDPGADWHWIA